MIICWSALWFSALWFSYHSMDYKYSTHFLFGVEIFSGLGRLLPEQQVDNFPTGFIFRSSSDSFGYVYTIQEHALDLWELENDKNKLFSLKKSVAVAAILFGNNLYISIGFWQDEMSPYLASVFHSSSLFLSVPCSISVTWTLFVCYDTDKTATHDVLHTSYILVFQTVNQN